MRRNIRIIYVTYDDKGRDQYTSTRRVGLDEPLRTVALSVINESIGKTKHNWLKETQEDQPLVFYLEGSSDNVLQKFGIEYGINPDSSIQFLNPLEPLQRNWTLGEIYELRDAGYIKGDKNSIVVASPEGLGGGVESAMYVLQAIIYIGGIYQGFQAIEKIIAYVKNRALLRKWKDMNLHGLRQIRKFMDNKSVWTTNEVVKRLAVTENFAVNILTRLGYEKHGDRWELSQSQKSLEVRSRWLKKEVEIDEKINPHQRNEY